MKAQLILLENPIIVTDEEIKENDKFLTSDGNVFEYKNGYTPSDTNCGVEGCKKVINKPIDYNGIDFGIVDVEKFVRDRYGIYHHIKIEDLYEDRREDIIHDIEVINDWQQLNEKKFTLEQIEKALSMAFFACQDGYDITTKEIIASISLPKTFDIEIEETPTNIKIIKKL